MFSFHKPKVYRSGSGCCICRAKSSSSRFTDSKRYEEDFERCFKLCEVRSGEICNACVLLVKRWKKLPSGSQRNWNHVVDARASHGSRPMAKMNKKKPGKEEKGLSRDNAEKDKKQGLFMPEITHNNPRTRELSPSGFSDDVQLECMSSESGSFHSSREGSPVPSPQPSTSRTESTAGSLNLQNLPASGYNRRRRFRGKKPKKFNLALTSFLDLNFWKREKTCCGIIFKGPFGELLLDRRYLHPCLCRSASSSAVTSPEFENVPNVELSSRLEECFVNDSSEGQEHLGPNNSIGGGGPGSGDAFRVLTNVGPTQQLSDNYGRCSQISAID